MSFTDNTKKVGLLKLLWRHFTDSIICDTLKLCGYVLIFLLIAAAFFNLVIPKDSTDGEARSGLSIHTDALTGCQYLSRSSNLTPRLGKDGKQLCEGSK